MQSIPDLLQLLNPWELPRSLDLAPSERDLVLPALQQALKALTQTDERKGLDIIQSALKSLGQLDSQALPISNSKTSLQVWEIEDYDRYFGVQHVQTDTPGICMVQGLLLVLHSFLTLSLENEQLSESALQIQRDGFISYVKLLARVFKLELK